MSIGVDPVRNPVNVTLSDGSIRNSYELRLRNKQGEAKTFTVGAGDGRGAPIPGLAVALEGGASSVAVTQDATFQQRVYLTAPPGSALAKGAQTEVTMWIEDTASGRRATVGTVFHGAER